MKILREDEKRKCFNLRTDTPWPAIGRLFTTARSRIAGKRCFCQELSKEGFGRIVILGAGLDTFALPESPWLARQQIRIYEVDHPTTQGMGNAQALGRSSNRTSRPWLILVPVDFRAGDDVGREARRRRTFSKKTRPRFFSTWLGVVAISDTGRYRAALWTTFRQSRTRRWCFDYMEPRAFSEELRAN